MQHWLADGYELCRTYYGIDPALFLVLYVGKTFVFYFSLFKIVQCLRWRRWERIPGFVFLNVSTNMAPWMYVYLYGQHHPWWLPPMLVWMLVYSIGFLAWEIRRKMKQFARGELAEHGSRRLALAHSGADSVSDRPGL